jgi:hypothetical protein
MKNNIAMSSITYGRACEEENRGIMETIQVSAEMKSSLQMLAKKEDA